MLVVLYHMAGFGIVTPDFYAPLPERAFPSIAAYRSFGWVGVQIFFVISGFVIAASAHNATTRNFLAKRAIRVLPALWVSALLAFALRLLWGEPLAELLNALVRSLILSPDGPYIDGVVWTLVIEAVFYIFVACVMLAGRHGSDRAKALETSALFLGAISAAFLTVHLVVTLADLNVGGVGLPQLMSRFFFDVMMLRHGAFFAIGMLLFQVTTRGATTARISALVVFSLAGCVQIALNAGLGDYWIPIAIWMAGNLALLAAVRGSAIRLPEKAARMSACIGLLTYPLYLNHFTVGQSIVPVIARYVADRSILFAVTLAIMLVLAWLIMQWPERLGQKAFRTLLLERQAPAGPAPGWRAAGDHGKEASRGAAIRRSMRLQ